MIILDFLYNLCYRATFSKGIKHIRTQIMITYIISSFFMSIANFSLPAMFPRGQVGATAIAVWLLIVLPPTIYTYRRYNNRNLYLEIFKKYGHYSEQQNIRLRVAGIVVFILSFILNPLGMVIGFKLFY